MVFFYNSSKRQQHDSINMYNNDDGDVERANEKKRNNIMSQTKN